MKKQKQYIPTTGVTKTPLWRGGWGCVKASTLHFLLLLTLLLPACTPSEDVTLPTAGTSDITITTPPKPQFTTDGVNTRFNQETRSWEIGDKATVSLNTKNVNGNYKSDKFPITCTEVNTDGTATWKFDHFSTDGLYETLNYYRFDYYSPDRYGSTADNICYESQGLDTNLSDFVANGCNLSLTGLVHDNPRFRLTGLQEGDYVTINTQSYWKLYKQPNASIIKDIRFIAKDNEDTDIYMYTYEITPVTITVARKGVTLSKTLQFKSTEGDSYTIDISQFKAFDGENPQDVIWIHNASELEAFAKAVNNGNSYQGKTVRLACDIDCSGVDNFPVIGTDDMIRPNDLKSFNGTFDGNGYTISGLKMSDNDHVALFYRIGEYGTVKNLTVKPFSITNNQAAAGFALFNYGTIDCCAVMGGTISTTSTNQVVAGFVAQNEGKITYCTVSDITLSGNFVSGFSYFNSGTIERCGVNSSITLSGNGVAGFVNTNYGGHYIINCYTDVKVSDNTTPAFCETNSGSITHSRQGSTKVNTDSSVPETGFYKTDGAGNVTGLFWE